MAISSGKGLTRDHEQQNVEKWAKWFTSALEIATCSIDHTPLRPTEEYLEVFKRHVVGRGKLISEEWGVLKVATIHRWAVIALKTGPSLEYSRPWSKICTGEPNHLILSSKFIF